MNRDAHRSYQDTPYPDFRKHVNIWADLERLRPKGDCVLVRVLPEPEMHANLIWIPERARGKGDNSPRIGEAVAIGLGDRMFCWQCQDCLRRGRPHWTTSRSTWKAPEPCPNCQSRDLDLKRIERHRMYVKPGDRVVFWRVFANQHVINSEVFQFIREETQILAVIDKEGPDASTN